MFESASKRGLRPEPWVGRLLRTESLVLHSPGHLVGQVARELPFDNPKRQVDAARHSTARHEVAVIDHPLVDHLDPEVAQVDLRRPVRARPATLDQARVSQHQRPGADAADQRTRRARRSEKRQPVPPLDLAPGAYFVSRRPSPSGTINTSASPGSKTPSGRNLRP